MAPYDVVQNNSDGALQLAYVGSRTSRHREGKGSGVEVFTLSGTEPLWTKIQTLRMDNPTFLIRSPNQQALYVAHGDSTQVSVLDIQATGHIRHRATVDSGGVNPVHLALSPGGEFLMVANHNSGTVASLPIRPDQSLGKPSSVLELIGELGPHRRDQNGPKPHQVVFDNAGQFALVPDKGTDSIFVLEIADDGTLTMDPGRTVRLREMSGPRHIVFGPDGVSAFSVEEFRSTVTRYDWDALRGRLTPRQVLSSLPDTMTGESRGAEIAIDPAGTHLYVSNRGGPGDHTPGGYFPDTIGVFAISPTGLGNARWVETLGIRPRFFSFDPSGSTLLVAHERGHSIAAHHVSADTGDLGPGVVVATTGSPVAIVRHELLPV